MVSLFFFENTIISKSKLNFIFNVSFVPSSFLFWP